MLAKLTTRPQPRSRIPGTNARIALTVPSTLTSRTRRQSSGEVSSSGWPGPTMPAELTSTSIGPISSAMPRSASWSVTSAETSAPCRSSVVTVSPSARSRSAVAAPSPRPPPVTSAVLVVVPLVGCRGSMVGQPSNKSRYGLILRSPISGEPSVKLMRIGTAGTEKPVARIDDDTYVDLSDLVTDFDETFFGEGGLDRIRPVVAERAAAGQVSRFAGERVGAPIARPHQILCIGLNYRDHAAETGQAVPDEPILFTKSPNTLVGPNDDIRIPRGSTKTDWEVELGIVIGSRTSYLDSVADAAAAIAGYLLVNDVSERAFQIERGGQWSKGKSAETFNPAGPWLATPDEIPDVLDLGMWLDVNGVRRQTGNTRTMVFDPHFIVHYLSQFMVLEPGDLINTGTPPGVGMGHRPQIWLRAGDVVELGIDRLRRGRQPVVGPR